MDRETFKVLWKMSEADHPAAGCFRRLSQYEYFVGTKGLYAGLDVMPDVRVHAHTLGRRSLFPVSGIRFLGAKPRRRLRLQFYNYDNRNATIPSLLAIYIPRKRRLNCSH